MKGATFVDSPARVGTTVHRVRVPGSAAASDRLSVVQALPGLVQFAYEYDVASDTTEIAWEVRER